MEQDDPTQPPSLTQALQTSLNGTRKREQQVLSLQKQVDGHTRQRSEYVADMRNAWLKEKERKRKELQRLDTELTKAVSSQDAGRHALPHALRTLEVEAPNEDEHEGDQMVEGWKHEGHDLAESQRAEPLELAGFPPDRFGSELKTLRAPAKRHRQCQVGTHDSRHRKLCRPAL